MNLVRKLRLEAGVTQQLLAATAGTSQATIAAYESGAKSPTLRTLENLADSQGLEMVTTYMPRLTREDRRSLAFHYAIAKLLVNKPVATRSQATSNLKRLARLHRGAGKLFEQWQAWLALPIDDLISNMLDPLPEGREMRQVSPFSGILKPRDRTQILRQFRKEHAP